MMTEGFGGQCPNCGYTNMFQRYGSSGCWQVDYCPNCGFGCGYADGDDAPSYGDKTRDAVLHGLKKMLETDGFPVTRKGLFDWTFKNCKDIAPSGNTFSYDEQEVKAIMKCVEDKTTYCLVHEKVLLT